ncbi:MAG TPA: phytanoyl-CoA dioxygenase family protein [Candidatus Saccharimonadales bacterium]|nr:phytanoyl-CoA dioxygenase family protein [Candidatus Saccharimonadales bacterium]
MSANLLSVHERRHFLDQGYLKLLQVYDGKEVEELRSFVDVEATKERRRQQIIGNRTLKVYGLYDRNPELMGRIIKSRRLIKALVGILGPNVVFVKNRHNHATVNDQIGEPAEGLHRDVLQPTRGLITAVLYLEDANVSNGATRVIPGSHNLPYVGVPQANGGGTWMHEHEEYAGMEDQALPVPVAEGGVLIFNALLFHGAGQNFTGSPRRSITMGFRSVDELDIDPDVSRLVLTSGAYIYRGNDTQPR